MKETKKMNKKKIEESKSEKIIKKKSEKKYGKNCSLYPNKKKDKPKMEMKFFLSFLSFIRKKKNKKKPKQISVY